MHDELLVRVNHRVADFQKQAHPRRYSKPFAIAVVYQRQPLHVLHDEVRLALRRGAAIQQARDAVMLQLREDLALPAEPPLHAGIATPAGNQLDGHLLAILAVRPFAQVDHTHTAVAQLAQDAILSDRLRQRRFRSQRRSRRHYGVQQRFRLFLVGQQRFHLAPQFGIVVAKPVESCGPLLRIGLQDAGQDGFDLSPALGGHQAAGPSI